MIYFPACKINLGLHILRKRADSYHDIETVMLEIPFSDVLEVIPSETFSFTSSGLEIPGTGNSCVDAFHLMQQEFGIPDVKIHLHKNVPMGGGLGGGSSDGAWTLKALNELFSLNCSTTQLEDFAARLGSDTPFFICGGLQLATGRGEVLASLQIALPSWDFVIVNLGIHIPTAMAYSLVTPDENRPSLDAIIKSPVSEWKNVLVNDFEVSAFANYPELAQLKSDLYNAGAVYAAMSGSGSTLFGLFEKRPDSVHWSKKPVYEVWGSL